MTQISFELGQSTLMEGDFSCVPRAGEAVELLDVCYTVVSVLYVVYEVGGIAAIVRLK